MDPNQTLEDLTLYVGHDYSSLDDTCLKAQYLDMYQQVHLDIYETFGRNQGD